MKTLNINTDIATNDKLTTKEWIKVGLALTIAFGSLATILAFLSL